MIISLIVGFKIISKSFKVPEKKKGFITVGLTYIFLSSAYWGVTFSFLLITIMDITLTAFLYIFIANAFIFLAVIFWLYSFFQFKGVKHGKLLWPICLLILCIYEVIFLVFIFSDYKLIAVMTSKFDSKRSSFTLLFDIMAIVVSCGTGVIFSLDSLKSIKPRVRWKGRFLALAFISFAVGAFLDAAIRLNATALVIARLILSFSAISYYLGFFFPGKKENAST